METKLEDSNKGPDVDKKEKISPDGRLYSRESSPSSSARSSEFEDPLRADDFDAVSVVRKDEQIEQMLQQQGGVNTLQSPPIQTMERPPNSSSSYRIPSSVFARKKSGNPADWSINSDESLFSIRTGTASFTYDRFNWLMKSGELSPESYKYMDLQYPNSEDLQPSVDLISTAEPLHPSVDQISSVEPLHQSVDQISSVEPVESSSEHHNTEKSTDISTTGDASTSSEPAATMNAEEPGHKRVGSKINSDHHDSHSKSSLHDEQACLSRCSNASGQSFAFPSLVGELERGGSAKSRHTPQDKSQEQKTIPHTPHKPSPSNINQVHTGSSEAAPTSSWFSCCFSSCSCRS